jgi:hypothetical protein
MKTTDFSGEYDYEREEAQAEFTSFCEYRDEYTESEQEKEVQKIAAHWRKVLTPEGFDNFACAWNEQASAAGFGLDHLIILVYQDF